MIRKIIEINEELCNGCGLCAHACHEGAIGIVDGKAKLLRDDYCDGLGDCLPTCPMNAIRFIEREAPEYNEAEVLANKAASGNQINNWPVQIKLVSPFAPCFNGADLLIAADCTAYAYSTFHHDFMRNHITLIGCPKLDMVDYSEKLTEIFKNNNIKSITVTRMTVPCCGGLQYAVEKAVADSGKTIPVRVVTIGTDGNRVN